MVEYTRGEVSDDLRREFPGRDESPLGAEELVRFEFISLAPGRSRNFRLVVMEDGRLFYARNTAGDEADGGVFNVPLPDEPNLTLPGEVVAEIRKVLARSGFFEEAGYVANERTRDGSLAIVTARRDGDAQEVWYWNASSDATEYLHELAAAQEEPESYAEIVAQLKELQGRPGNE